MRPTGINKLKIAITWGVAVASLVLVLAANGTYGRMIEWASTEFVYAPSASDGYSSDLLSANGSIISLSDWTPEQTQKTVTIHIGRPAPQTEPTDPSEVTDGEPSTEAADPADASAATEETESTETTAPEEAVEESSQTEPEETQEPLETEPEVTWSDDEVRITLDDVAQGYLLCSAKVYEDHIEIIMERLEDSGFPLEALPVSVEIEWFDLRGTIRFDLLPNEIEVITNEDPTEETPGETEETEVPLEEPTEEPTEETVPERVVVTGLTPVRVMDTLDPNAPISCVKLNLDTLSDFTLTMLLNGEPLQKVWWSMDGEHYSLLYDSNELSFTWPYAQDWDGTLFLNFTDALSGAQRPTIAVDATDYQHQEFTPVLIGMPQTASPILKASQMPQTIEMETSWGSAKLQPVQIQRLVAHEDGSLDYAQDTALQASVTTNGILLTAQDLACPAAGSYRLIVQWVWNETVIKEQIIYFFINTH